jgi:truncated hemoglobin YjbI
MSFAMELLRTTAKRRTALLLVVRACIDSYQKRCSGRVLRQRELKFPQVTEEIDELLRCLAQFLTTKKDTVALTSDHREYAD